MTSTKLGTGAVTTRAIRDGAISGRKIGSGGVHASDLAGGSVRSAALANGAVTGAKLAPDSVKPDTTQPPWVSVEVFSAVLPANQNGFRVVGATCPVNHRAVGGGGGWVGAELTRRDRRPRRGREPADAAHGGDRHPEWVGGVRHRRGPIRSTGA